MKKETFEAASRLAGRIREVESLIKTNEYNIEHVKKNIDMAILQTDEDDDEVENDYYRSIDVNFRHDSVSEPRLKINFVMSPDDFKSILLSGLQAQRNDLVTRLQELNNEFEQLKD